MTIDYGQDGMVIAMQQWIDEALILLSKVHFSDEENKRFQELSKIAERGEWDLDEFSDYDCIVAEQEKLAASLTAEQMKKSTKKKGK